MKNIKTVSNFKRLIDKYDFTLGEGNNNKKGKYVSLEATTIDGGKISWLKYYPENDTIQLIGNTDQCNIWFCDTRKDFTPEKISEFVKDLNDVFRLSDDDSIFTIKEIIDPEDWQVIADIYDAYVDERYIA